MCRFLAYLLPYYIDPAFGHWPRLAEAFVILASCVDTEYLSYVSLSGQCVSTKR